MIELKSVYFDYSEEKSIFQDFSLNLARNEITGVLGPNGAGKTTLVRLINGLLRPQKGQIKIEGQDIKNKKVSEVAKQVGVVFQSSSYHFFASSVRQELAYTLQYPYKSTHEKEERINEVLTLFRLQDLSHRSPFTLSGGEKRRLALAIAYTLNPAYFVLDEPTVGLDLQGQQELTTLLNTFKNEGRGVLITSHDIEFIFTNVDRLIILVDGEILKEGTPQTVFFDLNLLKKAHLPEPQLNYLIRHLKEKNANFSHLKSGDEFVQHLISKIRERQ
ncbi:MAG: energy-coupling factor ABC transporter ATP-binding protein [Promethearchaeota archaeon]